jgi:glyoxylase-like metal-dependent hydrolase (beta-lactamase superfamily II)
MLRQWHSVTAIRVGDLGLVPGPEIFWMSHFGEMLPLRINVFLVEDANHIVLVNTGPPFGTWAGLDNAFNHMRRFEPDPILKILESRHLTPDDVDTVIVTPLQAYALGGLGMFPRATVCISRRGWLDVIAPVHFDQRRYMAIPDPILKYLVFEALSQKRLRLLGDEEEVVPGIRAWWAGAHHRGSLAVEIDTSEGALLITDTVFYLENIQEMHLLGIAESLNECRRTYQQVRNRADIVCSPYDPRVSSTASLAAGTLHNRLTDI